MFEVWTSNQATTASESSSSSFSNGDGNNDDYVDDDDNTVDEDGDDGVYVVLSGAESSRLGGHSCYNQLYNNQLFLYWHPFLIIAIFILMMIKKKILMISHGLWWANLA